MRTSFKHFATRGITLVEVVIATSIILVATLALLAVHSAYLKSALGTGDEVRAAYLAEEGIEATRFLRDNSWSSSIVPLANGTAYGLFLNGSLWQASATNTAVGTFQRTVTLTSVYRNATKDIVASTTAGAVLDSEARLVTTSVSWPANGATTTKRVATYLTNLYGN